ncbi:aldo/keto reductase [Micromonospora wenchangensis]|uniref:aldo/keto reductase n=1 Tax=Micromonospora wenchangensis TaxID=1185415 RepID=UPI00382CC39C
MLTGAITGRDQLTEGDWRAAAPRFTADSLDANLRLVAAVRAVAEEIGRTPAQAALAWLLAQGGDVLPIPGTKRVRYLEENAAAADLRLTHEPAGPAAGGGPRGRGGRRAVSGGRDADGRALAHRPTAFGH